jgi:prophage regulatory protein
MQKKQLFRLPKVEAEVQLSRSTIYLMIQRGEFPPPIKIGRRAVAWRESDIEAWISSRERGQEWV